MDLCRNFTVSGGLHSQYQPEQLFSSSSCSSKLGSLEDLFSCHAPDGDVGLEWLSIYVEDCLSSSGSCLPPAAPTNESHEEKGTYMAEAEEGDGPTAKPHQNTTPSSLHDLVIPGKARSKRKRRGLISNYCRSRSESKLSSWYSPLQIPPPDQNPPLLHQAYWLADSELILPKKEKEEGSNRGEEKEMMMAVMVGKKKKKKKKKKTNMMMMMMMEEQRRQQQQQQQTQPRRCSHCLAQRTPQWRAGPMGPKTLCNACGVRYKSGRLLPEYRPAKSPTFVSCKHSNSHKKVMEMRMSLLSSLPPTTTTHP